MDCIYLPNWIPDLINKSGVIYLQGNVCRDKWPWVLVVEEQIVFMQQAGCKCSLRESCLETQKLFLSVAWRWTWKGADFLFVALTIENEWL